MNILPLELRTLHLRSPHGTSLLLAGMILTLFTGCNKPPAAVSPPTVEVTAATVIPQDTPVEFEFVAQTQSSREVEIRARISASLNGRAPQLLLDPDVDLTKVPYPWWGHAPWILPLDPALDLSDRERKPAVGR